MVPFAVFGLFAAAAWFLLDMLAAGRSRAVERLDELKNPQLRKRKGEAATARRGDAVTKMLEKASPLAAPLQLKTELEVNKLKARLASAGFRGESASSIYLGMKFIGLLTGLVLGGGI